MWDEPDIEPETAKRLFTENLLNLTPSGLSDNGFRCFDRFFRMVNLNQHRLSKWNRTSFITENIELIGKSEGERGRVRERENNLQLYWQKILKEFSTFSV